MELSPKIDSRATKQSVGQGRGFGIETGSWSERFLRASEEHSDAALGRREES